MVSLRELIAELVGARRLLGLVVAVFAVLGIVVSLLMTPTYRATVLVAPASGDGAPGGLAALAGGLGGLADLAEFSFDFGKDVDQSLALLTSRHFVESFLKDEGVLPALYEDRWDGQRGTWRSGGGGWRTWRAALSRWLARLTGDRGVSAAGTGTSGSPSLWYAYEDFMNVVEIDRDRKTDLVTIGIDWKDPRLAAQWANGLVTRLNQHARQRAINEAQQSLRYLDQQLAADSTVELRQALYRLVEREHKKSMLAAVRQEFALRVLDPATVPEQRVSPRRTLMVIAAAMLGALLGSIFVVGRHLLRRGW